MQKIYIYFKKLYTGHDVALILSEKDFSTRRVKNKRTTSAKFKTILFLRLFVPPECVVRYAVSVSSDRAFQIQTSVRTRQHFKKSTGKRTIKPYRLYSCRFF